MINIYKSCITEDKNVTQNGSMCEIQVASNSKYQSLHLQYVVFLQL